MHVTPTTLAFISLTTVQYCLWIGSKWNLHMMQCADSKFIIGWVSANTYTCVMQTPMEILNITVTPGSHPNGYIVVSFFLMLSNIPLYEYSTNYLSGLLLMGIWDISIFKLLLTKSIWPSSLLNIIHLSSNK